MTKASAEELEHTGPAEKERLASAPQNEQLTRTPEPSLPKARGTELSVHINKSCTGKNQVERESYLGEKEEGQTRSMGKKESDLQ